METEQGVRETLTRAYRPAGLWGTDHAPSGRQVFCSPICRAVTVRVALPSFVGGFLILQFVITPCHCPHVSFGLINVGGKLISSQASRTCFQRPPAAVELLILQFTTFLLMKPNGRWKPRRAHGISFEKYDISDFSSTTVVIPASYFRTAAHDG